MQNEAIFSLYESFSMSESSIFNTFNTSHAKQSHVMAVTKLQPTGAGGLREVKRTGAPKVLVETCVCRLRRILLMPKSAICGPPSTLLSGRELNPLCALHALPAYHRRFVSLFRYNKTARSGDAVRQALHLWQHSQAVAAGKGRQESRPCK